jgi:hypothetical protein
MGIVTSSSSFSVLCIWFTVGVFCKFMVWLWLTEKQNENASGCLHYISEKSTQHRSLPQ